MNVPISLVLLLIASNVCTALFYFKESDLRWKLYRELGEEKRKRNARKQIRSMLR